MEYLNDKGYKELLSALDLLQLNPSNLFFWDWSLLKLVLSHYY